MNRNSSGEVDDGTDTTPARAVHVKKAPYTRCIAHAPNPKWGNSSRTGDEHPETDKPTDREKAIERYKEWIARGEGRHPLTQIGEFEGGVLGFLRVLIGSVTLHEPLVCDERVLLVSLDWSGKRLSESSRRGGLRA